MNASRLFLPVAMFLLSQSIQAQPVAQIRHSLFAPVADNKLRDMETDRPDVTESAITIDAGHFQYESDLLVFEQERSAASEEKNFIVNRANLKIGLTQSTALQIGLETYVWHKEITDQDHHVDRGKGFGDINIRVKQNLIGNNNGSFALALLPYIKLPTAAYVPDGKFEEGLIIPMQLKLPCEWKVGMQLEVDRLADKETEGMHMEYLQSLTVSHEIVKKLTAIAETYLTYDFKQHRCLNYLNAALQVDIVKDFKLDGGINYGLQRDALKRYFLGIAFRI